MRVLLTCIAKGLGDALCTLPALRALRRARPDDQLGFASRHPDLTPSWATSVAIPSSVPPPRKEYRDVSFPFFAGWDDILRTDLYDFSEWGTRFNWCRFPTMRARVAGLEPLPEDYHGVLELKPEHYRRARCLTGEGEYAVVMSGPLYSCWKPWEMSDRAKVVCALRSRIPTVIGLAGRDGKPLEGAVPIHGEPIRVSAAIIARARIYVGADTGISWLATLATSTPKVIVSRFDMPGSGSFNINSDPTVHEVFNDRPVDEVLRLVLGVLKGTA